MENSIDLWRAPGHLMRRAQQAHTAIWAEEVGGDLTSVQFAVLNTLREEPGLDQRTLGERIGADRSTTADVADRLERRGLISQERDPNDGRRRLLELTDRGARLHADLVPLVEQVEVRLLDGLDDQETEDLLLLLKRVVITHDEPTSKSHD